MKRRPTNSRQRAPQMLFVSVCGLPVARLPRDQLGALRRPDGRALLSLRQAAALFRIDPHVLAQLYRETFADLWPPTMGAGS